MTEEMLRHKGKQFRKQGAEPKKVPRIHIHLKPYVGSKYVAGVIKNMSVYGSVDDDIELLAEEVYQVIEEALAKKYKETK